MATPKNVILGISMMGGFVFIVSAVSLYVQNLYMQDMLCGCIIPVYMIIPLLSSLGIFVGTSVYYLTAGKAEKTEENVKRNMESTLVFLERGEREVISRLIEKGGEASQSSLSAGTGLGRVQVFRIVERLRRRGVIEKEPHGKTNMIRLAAGLKGLFSEGK